MFVKFSTVQSSTQIKRNYKPIAKGYLSLILMIGFMCQMSAQTVTLEGGTTGTDNDIYVINDDESPFDAAVRLQTKADNGFHHDWMMLARRNLGIFQIGYFGTTSHNNSQEKQFNSAPLSLTPEGDLTIARSARIGRVSLGSNSSYGFLSFNNLNTNSVFTKMTFSDNTINFLGNVGIENPNPNYALDINGTINATEILKNGVPIDVGSNSLWEEQVSGVITYNPLGSGSKLVGIGTDTPRSELDVNGGITSKSAKIIADGGNDALTLQTTSNAKEQGIAFQNSGNWYTWNMFRKNIGNNRADLVFAGGLESNVRQLRENLILHQDGGATLKGALKAEDILFNVGTIENPNFQNLENFINDDVLQNAVWTKTGNDINYNLGTVSIGNLVIDNTTPLVTSDDPSLTNFARIYDFEGITLNAGEFITQPNISIEPLKTVFNKPVSITPEFLNGDADYALNVQGKVTVNGNIIGGEVTKVDAENNPINHTTIKNTKFHNTSYFNVNGAFGVEGAASFLGETNFLGTISAEGGGALLGTYIIGNPLTGEGDSEFGTHLIGDVNIGGNLSSEFPGSSIISDVFGGLDFANTKLNVHSEAIFSGQFKVENRSTTANILEGPIFEVDVASANRKVDVGNSKDGALFNVHGRFFVRKDNAGTAITEEDIDDHTNISWVLKVDTKASTPTVSVGHSNTSDKFSLYNGHANFEVVGQSDLKHDVNIGTVDENKYALNVFSKNVTIGKEGEITEVDDDGNEIIVTDLAKIPTLDVYHRSNFHGDVIANRIAVAANPKTFDSWPDFVFETSYNLQSLAEVEAFIKENKHLPAVPSAKEVAEKGLDLFQMDATLLQKTEELTLYTIAQEKQIKKLEQQLLAQEERLKKLETLLLQKQ